MPFITKDRREVMGLPERFRPNDFVLQPGDLCYKHYKPMVESWRANPRWTTAHEIYKKMQDDISDLCIPSWDEIVAYELAWQVFFIKYVWPYELKKIEENGDI